MLQSTVGINLLGPSFRTPKVCGQFIENMGGNIYGGIWDDSLPPDRLWLGGIRRDVLEATKALRPPIIRFPGGLAADYYHWLDGVGPRHARPTKPNYAWRLTGPKIGKPERYLFGTDEFLEFCRYVGAEPMLTVNLGTGTPEEAAAWVDYCNGDPSTEYGSLRAKNGREETWDVKLWCVGNEQWLPISNGSSSPEKYGRRVLAYAKAMREVDPSIRLIACGLGYGWGESLTWEMLIPSLLLRPLYEPTKPFFNPTNWRDWNERLLKTAGEEIDMLSIHDYFPDKMKLRSWKPEETEDNFYWIVSGNSKSERTIRRVSEQLERLEPEGKKIEIAFDEWNVRYDLPSHSKANYGVAEGIYCACMLNSFLRAGDRLYCANFAQLVNALGMIITYDQGIFYTPSGYVFKLYGETLGELVVPCEVESGSFYSKKGRVESTYLDAAATASEGGERISLYLVNRSYDSPMKTTVIVKDHRPFRLVKTSTIGTPGPFVFNTPEDPRRAAIETGVVRSGTTRKGGPACVVLPPHTVNCVQLARS